MTKKYLSVLMLAYSVRAACQATAITLGAPTHTQPDTIRYYQINSESMTIINGDAVYKVNDQKVTEETWEKMTIGNQKLKKCTPCIVMTYDAHDTLVSIGMQYTRYQVGGPGGYTAFYPDGQVRVKGHYKENPTGKWDKASLHTYCGIKDGLWTFYDRSGRVTNTELYKDGVPVKH